MDQQLQERFKIVKKLNTFTQLELVRKLAPAISILEMVIGVNNRDKPKAPAMIMVLGYLPQDNYNHVLNVCLGCIGKIQLDGTVAKLTTPDGQLMFDDTTPEDVINLVYWVIEENVGDFLRTTLSKLD